MAYSSPHESVWVLVQAVQREHFMQVSTERSVLVLIYVPADVMSVQVMPNNDHVGLHCLGFCLVEPRMLVIYRYRIKETKEQSLW